MSKKIDNMGLRLIKLETEMRLVLDKPNEEDNWNLVDDSCGSVVYNVEQIKTFIQKVKEDIEKKAGRQMEGISQMYIDGLRYVKNIIDKRAGNL